MRNKGNVIIVDDEEIVRCAYQNELRQQGYEVESFDAAKRALSVLSEDWPGVLVSDIIMPGMDGLTLMTKVKAIDPELPVILITGQGDIPMAVKAIQDGAYDFLEKPFETEIFLDSVRRAQEKRRLVMEVRRLRFSLSGESGLPGKILGKSPAMEKLRQIVTNIADCDVDILLLGETGTGKDLVARCLHEQSKRRRGRFVAINCGAIPENIIESELFGHEAGAFTGASSRRIGKFEYAGKGTVFLDEIESMPLHLQTKLLRVLQDRVVERVGSNDPIPVDVRVIAATKEDLKKAYGEGRFRKDLYYRLNVVEIPLPPLRSRLEDIPFLFQNFITQSSARYNLSVPRLSGELFKSLQEKTWEGNVRELRNEAEKFVIGLNVDIAEWTAPPPSSPEEGRPRTFREQVADYEKDLIRNELVRHHGDLKKIQEALAIPRQTLYDKMKQYQLSRKDFL